MSEYRILTKSEYDKEAAYFESDEFMNMGSIRFSNDESEVLLEQEASKFPDTVDYLGMYTKDEIKTYLSEHSDDWVKPVED